MLSAAWFLTVVLAVAVQGKSLSMMDLQEMVDQLGDEIITHQGLGSHNNPLIGEDNVHYLDRESDEDEDEGQQEDPEEIPHPVLVHNFASGLHGLGQISGVAINPDDEPVVFSRGPIVWDMNSFDANNNLVKRVVISNDTLSTLDPDTGSVKSSWGSGLFYMPHGLTIDGAGNVYVTDVGLHQVMRFPAGKREPDLILGEKFVPGNDDSHFCKPTSVAVSDKTGFFFVADGYCNSRVLKYNPQGKLVKIIKGDWQVPHSLSLFEEEDVLCVADREGGKIDCFRAGLYRPQVGELQDETGSQISKYMAVGRPYAIAPKGTALLAVTGSPGVTGLTIDTSVQAGHNNGSPVVDHWGDKGDLTAPHDLAISMTGDAVYVAEIDPEKKNNLQKFEVLRSRDFI